jgi:hypothetical protein
MSTACIKWSLLFALAFAIGGCATQHVNWQARVGTYTYDDAVREYGPPDKDSTLSDGSVIADWVVREGHNVIAPQPYLMEPDNMGAATPAFNSAYVPTYYMQLTFGPDKRLKSYKNYYR